MQYIRHSNALLPASIREHACVVKQETPDPDDHLSAAKTEDLWDSEETVSAVGSDESTVTADDTDEGDSDSTVLNDKITVKMKDPDEKDCLSSSDNPNNTTLHEKVKQEPLDDCEHNSQDGKSFASEEKRIASDIIDFCKHFLNFSKSDIKICLIHVNAVYPSKEPPNASLYSSTKIITEKTNDLPTDNASIENAHVSKETHLTPFGSRKSRYITKVSQFSEELQKTNRTETLLVPGSCDSDSKNSLQEAESSACPADIVKRSSAELQKTVVENSCQFIARHNTPNSNSVENIEMASCYEPITVEKNDNLKLSDRNKRPELLPTQNGTPTMCKVINSSICEQPETNVYSEDISSNTACHVQSSIENANGSAFVRKEEESDSVTTSELIRSDSGTSPLVKSTSVHSSLLIPSKEELRRIIQTASSLSNSLPSSENKSCPLNSSPGNLNEDKNEMPEVVEIIRKGKRLSSKVNEAQIDHDPMSMIGEIEVLTIKRRKHSLSMPLNRVSNRSCIKTSTKHGANNNKNNESDTCKLVSEVHGVGKKEIDTSQQIMGNNTLWSKDVAVKSKHFERSFKQVDSDTELNSNERVKNSFSLKKTECALNHSDANTTATKVDVTKTRKWVNFNSPKEEKRNVQNESANEFPLKKMKVSADAAGEGSMIPSNLNAVKQESFTVNGKNNKDEMQISSTSLVVCNETDNFHFTVKRKLVDEYQNMKTIKLTSEEKDCFKAPFPYRNPRKELKRVSVLDRALDSKVLHQTNSLMHPSVFSSKTANEMNSNSSIKNINNRNDDSGSVKYSKASVIEDKHRDRSKLTNETSSDSNILSPKESDGGRGKILSSLVTGVSGRSFSNGSVDCPNAIYFKTSVSENKYKNPQKIKIETPPAEENIQPSDQENSISSNAIHLKLPIYENRYINSKKLEMAAVENIQSSNPGDPKSQKHKTSPAPIIFFERRGKNRVSSSKCLNENIGKRFMDISDFPSLILEWNANWLLTQRKTKKCAPVCNKYVDVKDSYENELDYYNTYFPLHLLSIWLKISDRWNRFPASFDCTFESQVEKLNFVKITLYTLLKGKDAYIWPKQEDIVLCKTTKPDGSEESLFGRVCNVMSKVCSHPQSINNFENKSDIRVLKFEIFCAELLDVPLKKTVNVQILSNIRIALLQNDALQHLNSSMKNIILDPKKYVSRWKYITLPPHADGKYMSRIFDSLTSTVRITVVDTPSPSGGILALSQLVTYFIENRSPVLVGLKSEESFMKLAKSLKQYNPVLAIKEQEVTLPEELRKFTLEVQSAVTSGTEIFRNCYVTLTLLSNVFLGDFSSAFADQNLTCILHNAHLCTEAETALLLYYDVKNLVLMGNQEAKNDMHSLLKKFGYNVSLFSRFCRAK